MDTKLKNNKISKGILVFIMIVSVSVMLLPLNSDIISIYDRRVKEFYESYDFNNYINDKYNELLSMVDTEYVREDQMEDIGQLEKEKNIEYIAVNNNTGKVITNSQYRSIKDFKQSKTGYVFVDGKNYNFKVTINSEENIKDGYGKVDEATLSENRHVEEIALSEEKEEVTDSKEKDISIYMVLPEVPKQSDFLNSRYNKNETINNYVKSINIALIASVITFIVAAFIYIKNKYSKINEDNKFYELYSKIPVEIKLLSIIFMVIIDFGCSASYFSYQDWGYDYFLKLDIETVILRIVLKIIYLTMIYLAIQNIKDETILKSSISKKICMIPIKAIGYIKNRLRNTMVAGKNIGLIRKILLIGVILIVINIMVYIATVAWLQWAWWGESWIGIIISTISSTICLIVIALYIISKLGYLNEIMEGIKKIKQGDVNYKIEVKGNDAFTVLAENINDIGNGLDNAIEDRLKSEKMKSELITNVSHDLKTPLTSILNYVDLLKQEDVKPEHLNDYIAVLDRKSKRLKVLIEDLFEAAKATSGTVELNIEKIQLNQLLTQSIAEMEAKVIEANLDMKVNFPENKVYINADGKKLFRVFENLISNIVKYSLTGTRVYIDLSIDENYSYITFKNISAYELNFDDGEITERFKRGDSSRHAEGSGLGLSIAKGLVEIQGGEFIIQTDGDLFKAIVKLELSKEQ